MKFAKRVFFWAGVYGVAVLAPMVFMEGRIGRDQPPPITHPEFFYGFLGLAILFQVVFFIIASSPIRMRPFMIPAILEKFVYTLAVVVLYLQNRVYPATLYISLVDPILGLLFIAAYRKTGPEI